VDSDKALCFNHTPQNICVYFFLRQPLSKILVKIFVLQLVAGYTTGLFFLFFVFVLGGGVIDL
jgi:hypothetical protein